MSALNARMAKYLPAGHHLESHAAKALTDFDMTVAWIFPLAGPLVHQDLKVVVVHDQVVGDGEDGRPQGMVAQTDERAVGFVDLITLVTRWSQAAPACETFGIGIVLDGSGLAGEVGGADDVDPWGRQQHDVGRLGQALSEFAFQAQNLPGFLLSVLVQLQGNASVLLGGDVAQGGLLGPIDHGLEGALLEADVGGVEGVTEGCHSSIA